MRRFTALVALLVPSALAAQTSIVVPGGFVGPGPVSSYEMLNGTSGTWRYLDYTYPSPNATVDYGPLSGGKGLLNDGFGATESWDVGYQNPPGGIQGQFVGWMIDPTITFLFGGTLDFDRMRVNFDIANTGGVGAPGPVTINGVTHTVTLPGGTAPFWAEFDITGITASTITTTFTRTSDWIMISEIQFSGTIESTVPEPATFALVGGGLLLVGAVARRRRRA